MRTRLAIACQGGGSQTAFAAGVLKALSEANPREKFEVVGISRTSGGALCATLIWYALRKNEMPIWRRLMGFWHDNTAQSALEPTTNSAAIYWMRGVNSGNLAPFQTSPGMPVMHAMNQSIAMLSQRQQFTDFWALLRKHIDFDEFADRRNQLEGNASLFHSLELVEHMNDLILAGAFQPGFLEQYEYTHPVPIPKSFALGQDKPYYSPWIEMSEEMQQTLDYEGKPDRSRENINRLIAHGEEPARAFLEERERCVAAARRLTA